MNLLTSAVSILKVATVATIGATILLRFMIRRHLRCFDINKVKNISGKTVVITGASSGIGKAVAYEFAKKKAHVVLACRDVNQGNEVALDIEQTYGVKVTVYELDLASLASVEKFATRIIKEEDHIDILINNAGIFKYNFSLSHDGIEEHFAVNYLGHFYLTNLLLPVLKNSAPSRIVMVSSSLHKYGKLHFETLNESNEYKGRTGYSNSKLAMCLHTIELAKRINGSKVNVYCVHPGIVRTNLARYVKWSWLTKKVASFFAAIFLATPLEGCQTILYCSLAEELQSQNGQYYGYCQEEIWSKTVLLNQQYAEKLWNFSSDLINAKCQ